MRPFQVPIEGLQPGDVIALPKLGQGIQPRPYVEFLRFEDVIGYDRFRCWFYARGVRLLGDGGEQPETFSLDTRYAVWVVERAGTGSV